MEPGFIQARAEAGVWRPHRWLSSWAWVLSEAALVGQCQVSEVRFPCWGGGLPSCPTLPGISHCGDEGQGEKAPVLGYWA